MNETAYTDNLFAYNRIPTERVNVGNISIGADAPIRVQSMTTTDTNDVTATADQSERIVLAGGELVRFTTQGVREARSAGLVKQELLRRGVSTPIVADVHFSPTAAITAAALVDAVRINPGNFTGEAKKFDSSADNMSDSQWHDLLIEKLRPLVSECISHNTALRLGINHGSLSDRIMARYGDTPQGMVASCTEYLDALEELGFFRTVISIKSSNTRVMVHTVRLLIATLRSRSRVYPLHLGVTEAGSDAEGRIKSAAGIGALLADGIGDTIRVSLTEEPEAEIPVARMLVSHVDSWHGVSVPHLSDTSAYSPYAYRRRQSSSVGMLGGSNPPTFLSSLDDLSADSVRIFTPQSASPAIEVRAEVLRMEASADHRPIVVCYNSDIRNYEAFQVVAAADLGLLFIDGLVDGLYLANPNLTHSQLSNFADMLLQATRARFSHAEFISCPGCGRTLYDLRTTTRTIKQRFGHLKDIKIGIMGCIVNGIGEMADADYGYVGAARGSVSLYRGKTLIERNIPTEQAIARLEQIIRGDGKWKDPF